MKNIVHILIDAAGSFNIGASNTRNSPTPFLDSMIKNGLFSSNMQTQGPYTEAALISHLGGTNTMQNGGYLLGMTSVPETLAESLQKKVFFENKFNALDAKICEELLRDLFATWQIQLKNLLTKEKRTEIITGYLELNKGNNIEKIAKKVSEEKKKFDKQKQEYIENLFKTWDEHPLFKIPEIVIKEKATNNTKEYIKEEYSKKAKIWQEKCNKRAKKNIRLKPSYLINVFDTYATGLRNKAGMVKAVVKKRNAICNSEALLAHINSSCEKSRAEASAHTQLKWFKKRIIELDGVGKNYYTFIHLMDFHFPPKSFTYDTDDISIIQSEFADMESYINNLPENYNGNIELDLSMLYLDRKLEKFVTDIQNNTSNDVIFVIVADHGNPFYYNPIRPNWDNSCYENFSIPFILFGKDVPIVRYDKAISSIDILPTILRYSGNDTVLDYIGQVIGDKNFQFKDVGAEYMGPGCPDYTRREVRYSLMNDSYKIGVRALLSKDITDENIFEIYDLKRDSGQDVYNLCKKLKNNPEVICLLAKVSRRHKELQKLLV